MWTRREVVVGGSLVVLFADISRCCCAAEKLAPNTFGCCLADQDVNAVYPNGTDTRMYLTGDEPMIPKSGDRDFDFALAQTLAKLSDMFHVLPGFAYYSDDDGMNAYATSVRRMNRADGTVLMGARLLRKLLAGRESPDVSVAAVCSHEFGHILQYKHDLHRQINAGQPNVKRSELQADYFAGYFAGMRKRERSNYPAAVVAMTQFAMGDNNFSSRTHHGTRQERGDAVVRGFEAAFKERKSLSDAIEQSTRYVMGI